MLIFEKTGPLSEVCWLFRGIIDPSVQTMSCISSNWPSLSLSLIFYHTFSVIFSQSLRGALWMGRFIPSLQTSRPVLSLLCIKFFYLPKGHGVKGHHSTYIISLWRFFQCQVTFLIHITSDQVALEQMSTLNLEKNVQTGVSCVKPESCGLTLLNPCYSFE